jgi:hypothetical protein
MAILVKVVVSVALNPHHVSGVIIRGTSWSRWRSEQTRVIEFCTTIHRLVSQRGLHGSICHISKQVHQSRFASIDESRIKMCVFVSGHHSG